MIQLVQFIKIIIILVYISIFYVPEVRQSRNVTGNVTRSKFLPVEAKVFVLYLFWVQRCRSNPKRIYVFVCVCVPSNGPQTLPRCPWRWRCRWQ